MPNNQNKTMDFFRTSRPTDPLVSRPAIRSVSTPVKPQFVSTSPKFRSGSGVPPKSQFNRSPVVQSSVSVKKVVVEKTSPTSASTSVTSTSTVTSTVKTPTPVPTPVPDPSPVQVNEPDPDDAWLDSIEETAFAPKEKESKEGKVSYPFGGESPFLKSVKVEKRPLSNSIPERTSFNSDKRASKRKDPVRIVNRSRKKSNALSLAVIIIITIVLGVAVGIGVFLLIAK